MMAPIMLYRMLAEGRSMLWEDQFRIGTYFLLIVMYWLFSLVHRKWTASRSYTQTIHCVVNGMCAIMMQSQYEEFRLSPEILYAVIAPYFLQLMKPNQWYMHTFNWFTFFIIFFVPCSIVFESSYDH